MERKGAYVKGHAGHVRNVGMYRLYMQKAKKWRGPITAFVAVLMVFGLAPSVGDEFQASLLTNPGTETAIKANPEQARKIMLNSLAEFINDCERFKMTECASAGRGLVKDVINSGDRLLELLPAIEDYESRYEHEVAVNACKFDLNGLVLKGKELKKSVAGFTERYGEALGVASLTENANKLSSSVTSLDELVSSCTLN
ncbi:hypothetical protein HZA42_02495 [Candidatus Peregrinibacteria bacterium]|nr:hypothetical protein [Candidatus Peregrinibacteria bacterium]